MLVPADLGSSTSLGGRGRQRKTSIGAGFFGSLRGLFGGKSNKEDWYLGINGEAGWGKKLSKGKGKGKGRMLSDDEDGGNPVRIVPLGFGGRGSPGNPGRGRVASDAGVGGGVRGVGGKRLRKGRNVKKGSGGVVDGAGGSPVGDGGMLDALKNLDVDGDGVKKAEEWVGGQVGLGREQRERKISQENGDGQVERGEKGWMSDGDVTVTIVGRGDGGRGVIRRKSKGKGTGTGTGKNKTNETESETETENVAGVGPSLSRNSSLKNASGVPAGRRASLGAGPSSGVLNPEYRRRMSLDEEGGGTGKVKSKSAGGVRKASVRAATASGMGAGSGTVSLMSIVEGMAKGNREGWGRESVGGTTNVAGGGVATSAVAGGDTEREGRSGSKVDVPRAPGSVFDIISTSTSANGGGIPTSISAPELPVGVGRGGGSKRPAKSPLRSALRNTSRTPSPLPAPASAQPLPPLEPTPAIIPAPVPEPSTSVAAPAPVSMVNGAPRVHDIKGKGRAMEEDNEESDDGASVSSYETGHEAFYDDEGEETEHEQKDHPPPPPPHDDDYQQHHARTATVQNHVVSLENHGQNHVINSVQNHGGGSDISASTASSSTPTAPQQRRKSVRVSLQPTFSSTPPALDEDEDVDHGPWNGRAGTNGVQDMWEDSSEEDVEYQKAKKMLTRIARREKKNRQNFS